MHKQHNLSNPAIKRIMQEAKELSADPSDEFEANPVDDDIFDWHFTVRGPDETPFAGGLYHGRIILPSDYPHKPPEFMFMTPNGRFEIGKKICLSISQHHPEHWQPSWGIRTALVALRSFMPTKGDGAIGSLDYKSEERVVLARKSRAWSCDRCGQCSERLLSAKVIYGTGKATTGAAAVNTSTSEEKQPDAETSDEKAATTATTANQDVESEESKTAEPQLPASSTTTSTQQEPSTPTPSSSSVPSSSSSSSAIPLRPTPAASSVSASSSLSATPVPSPALAPQPTPPRVVELRGLDQNEARQEQPRQQQLQQQQQENKDDAGLTFFAFAILFAIFALVVRRIIMHWDFIVDKI